LSLIGTSQDGRRARTCFRPFSSSLFAAIFLFILACLLPSGLLAADAAAIAWGEYLVTIGICASCHSPKDAEGKIVPGKHLSGGQRVGGLLASNLTSDIETGLGAWTDEQIIASIRNGIRPDGAPVRPPMGTFFYRDLSDVDVKAIVAYLRTVPAIKNPVERIGAQRSATSLDPVSAVAEIDPTNKLARGRYLAVTVSHCFQCHTPRINGLPDLKRLGAGGNTYTARGGGTVVASNITPAQLGSWSDDQIKAAITKGVRPDGGQLVGVMDFSMYARMDPEDLSALVAYLRSLPPMETSAP